MYDNKKKLFKLLIYNWTKFSDKIGYFISFY